MERSRIDEPLVDDLDMTGDGIVRPVGEMKALAKSTAIRQFADRLVEHGHSGAGASALARAAVDPADARRRLQHPTELHVPGGTLLAITVPVWAGAVIAHPANTREASNRRYPVAVPPGSSEAAKFPPPREVESSRLGDAELELLMQSRDHVVWALDRSADYLEQTNNLQQSIASQGVMLPITACVMRVVHADGSEDAHVVTAYDGSSRMASVHKLLELTPDDVVYGLPAEDGRFRRMTERILTAYGMPVEDVSEKELVLLRAIQVPATLLIGFRADAGSHVDFAGAMRSYVGLLHVEPPKEWDDAAERDAKGDSVLHEMLTSAVIDEDKRDYLAGMLAPAQAVAAGFEEHLDQRAAEIIQMFTSEDRLMWDVVGRGIKRLSAKTRITRAERAKVAAELALRAVRNGPLGSRVVTTRAALERALTMATFWSTPWSVTLRSPEEIRKAAATEIQRGEPGPSALELAALAVFWLTAHNMLVRESSRSDDQRSPQQMIGRLIESEHGISVLYQAITDGRNGTAIRAVAQDGRVLLNPAGRALEISDSWLRRTFRVPSTRTDNSDSASPHPAATPTQQLDARRRAVRQAVGHLSRAMEDMVAVRSFSGRPLIEEDGFPSDIADEIDQKLTSVMRDLTRYGYVWEQRLPAEAEDEDLGEAPETSR